MIINFIKRQRKIKLKDMRAYRKQNAKKEC